MTDDEPRPDPFEGCEWITLRGHFDPATGRYQFGCAIPIPPKAPEP